MENGRSGMSEHEATRYVHAMTVQQIEDEISRIQEELRQLFDEDRRLGEIVRARVLSDPGSWKHRSEVNLEQFEDAHRRIPVLRQEIESKRDELISLSERLHAMKDAEHARGK
ncbi:MAG: hypothetical protein OXN92_00900 [Gammaproteobacteria bacterium]|nr:hypothetical protein [Gammaproteobacteria bacterium]